MHNPDFLGAMCTALVAHSARLLSIIRVRWRSVRFYACSRIRSWSTSESNRCRLPVPHRCARHINTRLSYENGHWVLGRVVAAIVEGQLAGRAKYTNYWKRVRDKISGVAFSSPDETKHWDRMEECQVESCIAKPCWYMGLSESVTQGLWLRL